MSKHFFNNINKISDFQCLSIESGILLTKKNELYSYSGNNATKISTPTEFDITDFHFLDSNYGIIIGEGGQFEKEIQKGSLLPNFGLPILLSMVIVFILKTRLNHKLKNTITKLLSILIISAVIVSCSSKWQMYKSIDPDRSFITHILKAPYLPYSGFHTYFANKGIKPYISITEDGGKSWKTHNAKTNFHLTDVTAIGDNYFVGSFANYNTSKNIPYHGDGEVYIYGMDSSFCQDLIHNNDLNAPYGIGVRRGVIGFYHDQKNETLYIYGSETEPTFPKDQISTSKGNISQISTNLRSNYRIIDVPGNINVSSLTLNNQSDIWVILDNKTPEIVNRYVEFKDLPNRKLLVLKKDAENWKEINVNEKVKSYLQIEFISDSDIGFLITEENKELFKTVDGGETWSKIALKGVVKLTLFNDSIWGLNENNEIFQLDYRM